MSLKITRDGIRGRYSLEPEGPPGEPIPPVSVESIDEIGAAIAHYFRVDKDDRRHEIYKRRGLCPLCNAMTEEAKGPMKAWEVLSSLGIENCPECHCPIGPDWEYVDFTNKTVTACPQCGTLAQLKEKS